MHEFGLNYISPLNYSIFLPSSFNSGTKRLFGHTFLSLLTDKEKRSYCSMKLANAQKNTRGLERCVISQVNSTLFGYMSMSIHGVFRFFSPYLWGINFIFYGRRETEEETQEKLAKDLALDSGDG